MCLNNTVILVFEFGPVEEKKNNFIKKNILKVFNIFNWRAPFIAFGSHQVSAKKKTFFKNVTIPSLLYTQIANQDTSKSNTSI